MVAKLVTRSISSRSFLLSVCSPVQKITHVAGLVGLSPLRVDESNVGERRTLRRLGAERHSEFSKELVFFSSRKNSEFFLVSPETQKQRQKNDSSIQPLVLPFRFSPCSLLQSTEGEYSLFS